VLSSYPRVLEARAFSQENLRSPETHTSLRERIADFFRKTVTGDHYLDRRFAPNSEQQQMDSVISSRGNIGTPRKVRRLRAFDRGFNMIELMFSILICSIVLMGLLGVLGSLIRDQAEGRTYERVSLAASTVFGEAGEAIARDFYAPLVPDIFAEGRQPVGDIEGVEFEISETQVRDDLKKVDIVLYWTDEKNAEHQKQMSTYFLKE
jgi:prepilin-type N-terminal cleavage/methylation domain-containing protein